MCRRTDVIPPIQRHRGWWLLAIAIGAAAAAGPGASAVAEGGRPLPARLDGYLTRHVKLTAA